MNNITEVKLQVLLKKEIFNSILRAQKFNLPKYSILKNNYMKKIN